MTDIDNDPKPTKSPNNPLVKDGIKNDVSRCSAIKNGLALMGGGAIAASTSSLANSATPDPLITEVQDWNRYLGDGIDARPYGMPSQFEKEAVRRDVAWLTADSTSSVNFTPLHKTAGKWMLLQLASEQECWMSRLTKRNKQW